MAAEVQGRGEAAHFPKNVVARGFCNSGKGQLSCRLKHRLYWKRESLQGVINETAII